MKKVLVASIFAAVAVTPAAAAPVQLLATDASGNVTAGDYSTVAAAIAAGSQITVVYPRSGRVISRPCSSAIDYNDDGTAYCFIADAFDTIDPVGFTNPVAFEYIIISTEGSRQTVKRDLGGNQLTFQGGSCDGAKICMDQIAVTWYSAD
ncbi:MULTISPECIES: hypothetical protein [unclassified Devosia]|uniref:hypothetical protein n=1 Tax=unclassified Devosia TaxID=196773 RepID=UPI00086A7AF1|nr:MULTISPECIES: hypothetical protein [unclassified Devosia]MBN9360695.1 hypothetical protein [Devosia sp.]ODS87888.1 MAG: hypothetical protein ABS47_10905 [Devosia sp. SCN 66-27]OJX22664.1 MAG: hypothetical protein BGO83_17880 [Devosia sp. 66-14]